MNINKMHTNKQGRTYGIIMSLYRHQGYKGNPIMFSIRVRLFGRTFSYRTKNFVQMFASNYISKISKGETK